MRPSLPRATLKIRAKNVEQPALAPFVSRKVRYCRNEDRTRTRSRQWNFDHLVPHRIPILAKGNTRRQPSGTERTENFVHFDDRIKFWNIAPGDRVIIADAPANDRGKIRHVAWVDRARNLMGMFEEDCRESDNLKGYFRSPLREQTVYKKYEYTTVRLMKPGSDDVYYEDLREDNITSGPSPRERGRKKIEWTRTGIAHSLSQKGPLTGEREAIPWPPVPKWKLDYHWTTDRAVPLQEYIEHCKRVAPPEEERKALQARLDAMTTMERREWEAEQREEKARLRKQPYGAKDAKRRSRNWEYLYTNEKLAWQRTFTSQPYQSSDHLWLSQDPSIRFRFPELFWRDEPSHSPSTLAPASANTFTKAQLVPQHIPELAVGSWEFFAGWHTARARLKRFETKMRERVRTKVDAEVAMLVEAARNNGEELSPQKQSELRDMVARLHRFESRLRPRKGKGVMKREDRRKRRVLVSQARHVVGNMKHKYDQQKVQAALRLLPLLEKYNTQRKRGELVQLVLGSGSGEGKAAEKGGDGAPMRVDTVGGEVLHGKTESPSSISP